MTGKNLAVKKQAYVANAVAMSEADVIDLIKRGQGELSLREYGKQLRVSASYLSDIYLGRRFPGEKILKRFGITKTRRITFEYVQHLKP